MPNPTGTIYLTENTGYVWTDGDVYEIVQTDQQEGAALGASFGGLGVDNQPHQILLNKVKLVHGKQLTDEANIGELLAFQASFLGSMGSNGYLKLPILDASRGAIFYIIQWGEYLPGNATGDNAVTINWNIAFPSACVWANANMVYPAGHSPDVGIGVQANGAGVPELTPTQGTFYLNLFNVNGNCTGFMWIAIGY